MRKGKQASGSVTLGSAGPNFNVNKRSMLSNKRKENMSEREGEIDRASDENTSGTEDDELEVGSNERHNQTSTERLVINDYANKRYEMGGESQAMGRRQSKNLICSYSSASNTQKTPFS